jgi:nitrogen fixation NifU-like protein
LRSAAGLQLVVDCNPQTQIYLTSTEHVATAAPSLSSGQALGCPYQPEVASLQYRYNLQMYSPQVLDHFEHPRNAGEIANPDASVQLENPACGDILKLTLRVTDGRITEIRFLAKGCVPAMACGSLLTEMVRGKTLPEARKLRREELVQAIGGMPEASTHAGHLAMDALAAALKQTKG